jgi:exportin-7
LESSQQSYAQLIAATSLEHVVTNFWNNFTLQQKLDVRAFVLSMLATRGPGLQDFVVTQLSKLCGRVTKLGWFDAQDFREVLEGVQALLDASLDHRLLGVRILLSLVDEMNLPTSGRTLTVHRKVAVSFRDQMLLQVLQLALNSLQTLYSLVKSQSLSEKEKKLSQHLLSLVCQCLSYDFIGTNPEESAEDVGTVQVPSSWRATMQDPQTMTLLFDWYACTEPPRSQLALEALVQLSSVRRSLFASEAERTLFLHSLMRNVQNVMSTQCGLEHVDNYHEFCRLLGRLKANYQLSELVKTPGFNEWLELAGEFTIRSLQNWEYSMNSIHYLLALWGRLVAALPYLRADAAESQRQAQTLRSCVLRVTQSYIQTMLDSAQVVVEGDGSVDDPLDDEGSLREQMDRLPGIARLQFESVAQFLLSAFEQTLSLYEPLLSQTMLATSVTGVQKQQIAVCELRLSWLVHMVSACVDSQGTSETRRAQSEMVWDGRLSRLVFQLVTLLDARMVQSQGRGRCDIKLETAILVFFKSFKKVYLLESSVSAAVAIPGGSPAHPLLSLALSSYRSEEKDSSDVVSVRFRYVFDFV